jgi:hypothetical protein
MLPSALALIIATTAASTLCAQTITPTAGIVYVKQTGAGSQDGSSWANAAPQLADALKAAKTNPAIQQIWVATGTYKPLYSPLDYNFGNYHGRNNAFLLVNNRVYTSDINSPIFGI